MVPSHLRLHVSVRTGAGTVCSEAQARGLEVNCCCWREVNCEQESEQQQEAKGQRPCLEVELLGRERQLRAAKSRSRNVIHIGQLPVILHTHDIPIFQKLLETVEFQFAALICKSRYWLSNNHPTPRLSGYPDIRRDIVEIVYPVRLRLMVLPIRIGYGYTEYVSGTVKVIRAVYPDRLRLYRVRIRIGYGC